MRQQFFFLLCLLVARGWNCVRPLNIGQYGSNATSNRIHSSCSSGVLQKMSWLAPLASLSPLLLTPSKGIFLHALCLNSLFSSLSVSRYCWQHALHRWRLQQPRWEHYTAPALLGGRTACCVGYCCRAKACRYWQRTVILVSFVLSP